MSAPTIDHTLDEILNLAALHFKVPREKLAPDDDFFKTQGIDSLQSLDLLPQLERPFRMELPDYAVQGGRPGGDRHDESVEVADFGILDFFLRRRAGSSGLQVDRGGASATAGTF